MSNPLNISHLYHLFATLAALSSGTLLGCLVGLPFSWMGAGFAVGFFVQRETLAWANGRRGSDTILDLLIPVLVVAAWLLLFPSVGS